MQFFMHIKREDNVGVALKNEARGKYTIVLELQLLAVPAIPIRGNSMVMVGRELRIFAESFFEAYPRR